MKAKRTTKNRYKGKYHGNGVQHLKKLKEVIKEVAEVVNKPTEEQLEVKDN